MAPGKQKCHVCSEHRIFESSPVDSAGCHPRYHCGFNVAVVDDACFIQTEEPQQTREPSPE